MTGAVRSLAARLASALEIVQGPRVVCWGDSLTVGAGQTSYPTQLAALAGFNPQNKGVGGETSTQIAARMTADAANLPCFAIIWAGRNDYNAPATVKANIAAMVAALGHTNYRVLTVLNGDYATEYAGQAGYLQIKDINDWIIATYGARAVDVRAALVAAYDPGTPQDVTDHGRDVPPSTLRTDQIHLNTAGYAVVAAQIAATVTEPQGFGKLLTTSLLRLFLGSPPCDIGTVAPVKVKASALQVAGWSAKAAGDGVSLESAGRIVPDASGTRDLGASILKWNGIYGTTIWVGDRRIYPSGSGDIQASSRLLPDTNNAYDLGALTVAWRTGYFGTSVFIGTKRVYLTAGGDLQTSSRWLPDTDGAYDHGAGVLRWRDGYYSGRVYVGASPVLSSRQPAVANATDNASAITQLNALLLALRNHGLIEP